jgi:hypothetical protein
MWAAAIGPSLGRLATACLDSGGGEARTRFRSLRGRCTSGADRSFHFFAVATGCVPFALRLLRSADRGAGVAERVEESG